MEESPKQKTGFSQKLFPTVAALFGGISRELNMLTTDAIPDKSYTEKKPCTSQGKNPNTKVNGNNLEDNNNHSDSSDDERDIKKTWESKKKKTFFTKSKKEKSNAHSKGQKNVYYFNNINGLHVGNNYNVMHGVRVSAAQNANKEKESDKVRVEITQDIRDALSSKASLTTEHIMELQSHIGNNWMNLGRRLGFSDGQLEQIQSDFSPQRERIYQMLLDWIRNEADKSTVGFLCQCLWEEDEKQAVQKLAEHINNKSTKNVD